MLHLISISGNSARDFYLQDSHTPDFKSLLRSLTSGRGIVISTHFRSDILYSSETATLENVQKSWALYVDTDLSRVDHNDIDSIKGDEAALFGYFRSINKLARNWHEYRLYRKAFQAAVDGESDNPVARTVLLCDKYLLEHPSITRAPLVNPNETPDQIKESDTFELAMRIIKNDTHSN